MLDAQFRAEAHLKDAVEAATPRFSPNDAGFAQRVFDKGLKPYLDRVTQYGFAGRGRVLDAGCGFGQWSLALALAGNQVDAVDIAANRVEFLTDVAGALRLPVRAALGGIDKMPFPDATFDAVFCYGVLFLTDWKRSVAELLRVLRPGGLLYCNANGFGWYKHLWHTGHNRTPDYDPALRAARTLLNTWNYHNGHPLEPGMDILVTPEELAAELAAHGGWHIRTDGEGLLGTPPPGAEFRPFFQKEYMGDLGVYEVLAEKAPATRQLRGNASCRIRNVADCRNA
ncbi:MAG TPA: hypothetical protein DEF41_13015 [Desulfovibrio sp.]|uniref:class I SAM-dependent methyltransferase n=1 Tax=Nitratidesulfovibrio vulgaris TaxID=881 RepID=UPI000E99F9A3|nr:class I SAM-dependent methyltransferase [Nitratidesulfovibrio vulgaris]WCB46379.1 class I SAM-dependent methyltransferase [Nitratidesulfovibrio vulgaris]HBW17007.1 hypothetical protein [Desulfovibrio sp.]